MPVLISQWEARGVVTSTKAPLANPALLDSFEFPSSEICIEVYQSFQLFGTSGRTPTPIGQKSNAKLEYRIWIGTRVASYNKLYMENTPEFGDRNGTGQFIFTTEGWKKMQDGDLHVITLRASQ